MHKTVSTFETFMNNNKMKRRIFKMNNNMTTENDKDNEMKGMNCTLKGKSIINKKKYFSYLNSPPAFHNHIVKNEAKFRNEIKAISPTLGANKRKDFYLTDIMQTKYTFGPFSTLQRDKEHVKQVSSNELKFEKEDSVHKYMKGFKYKMDQPIRPLKLVKPSFMFK